MRTTGYVAQKGRYVPPVLFNPYTGEPRDARDIFSDPQGILIAPPGAELITARGIVSGAAGETPQAARPEGQEPGHEGTRTTPMAHQENKHG